MWSHDESRVDGLSIEVRNAGIRTKRGGVFDRISFSAGPGDIVAVCGPGGTGRTSLLLAIGGRMRLSRGELKIGGRSLPRSGPWVRANSSVCPAPDIDPLVDNMRVSEELRRAELLLRPSDRRPYERNELLDLVGFEATQQDLVGDLGQPDRTRLRLVLGLVARVPLIILDDLGDQVPAAGHEGLWQAVRMCATATGATIIASSLESEPARGVADQVVLIDAPNLALPEADVPNVGAA